MRWDQEDTTVNNRLTFTATGALAGLCLWLLIEYLDNYIDNIRLYTFVFASTSAFFTALLAMLGPVRLFPAVKSALAVALPSAALLVWASFRFVEPEEFLQTGHPIVAFALLVGMPLPFLIVIERHQGDWRNYEALFDQAWSIVVRYAAAWLFVAVFWSVVYLSDALLQIVGLELIEDLLDIDPVPFMLTGAALGVALAVVDELSDYVTPYLLVRLLRLLLPVFLVVVGIFIIALPLRGLSDLFGGFSTAAILMAMAIGAIMLISTAVDRNDLEAVQSRVMTLGTRGMILMNPVIAFLAVYAIWIRVAQYGWTPDRFAAAIAGGIVLIYALAYLIFSFSKDSWMARIRQVNIYLALGVLGLAFLFMSPVMNIQAMSINSQVARFEAGKTSVDELDLWSIRYDWGKRGEAGIARLSALTDHPDAERLQERLVTLETSDSEYAFDISTEQTTAQPARSELRAEVPVFAIPGGGAAALPAGVLDDVPTVQINQMQAGCARSTPAGHKGCAIVAVDLVPTATGREYLLIFLLGNDRVQIYALKRAQSGSYHIDYSPRNFRTHGGGLMDASVIDALHADQAESKPSGINVLSVGNAEIFIQP